MSAPVAAYHQSDHPAVRISVRLSVHPSIHFCLPAWLSIYLCVCLSLCLSIHPSIHLSIHPSIHPPIHVPMHLYDTTSMRLTASRFRVTRYCKWTSDRTPLDGWWARRKASVYTCTFKPQVCINPMTPTFAAAFVQKHLKNEMWIQKRCLNLIWKQSSRTFQLAAHLEQHVLELHKWRCISGAHSDGAVDPTVLLGV